MFKTEKILLLLLLIFITTLEAKKKPNVILIVADDHGYADMQHLGIHKDIKTPNLDALAKEGISFTEAYVTSPICSPSRCGIMTGQFQARNNNYFYGGSGIAAGTPTIAQGFKDNGYTTAYFGKLHYGNNDSPSSYNYPSSHGFDFCITAGHNGRVHYLFHNEQAIVKHGKSASPWLKNGQEFEEDGFSTEQISDWSQQFIEENVDQPFFIQVSFNAVHNFTFQLPNKYLKEWDLPYYPDYECIDEGVEEDEWYDKSILPNLPYGRAYYKAQLYYLDKEIGVIRKKLQSLDLDENTIIVYTSDNGGSNCSGGDNTPLKGTKYSLYEGGIRIPMIMCWKNKFEANSINNEMVSTLDLMPTLLAASGADKDTYAYSDGVNLLPHLMQNKALKRDEMVWDVGFAWAVRKGKWKLKVVNEQLKADRISEKQHTDLGKGVELFDLDSDISEEFNVAEEYPEIIKQLTIIYEAWKVDVLR